MKKFICGLALAVGLSFSCHAQGMKISAYPNTNNLAGTNLFLIAIVGSPGTNMNISYAQLSNLLAAAIGGGGGGAQVWTNDGTDTFLYDSNSVLKITPFSTASTPLQVGVISTNGNDGITIGVTCVDSNNGYPVGMRMNFTAPGQNLSGPVGMQVLSTCGSLDSAQWLYNGDMSQGILGQVTTSSGWETNSASIAVIGMGTGESQNQAGVEGYVNTSTTTIVSTNVAIVGSVINRTGVTVAGSQFVGGYFEASLSVAVDPALQTSVLLADSRETGYPLFIGRTNNATITASLGSSGVWTNNGNFYPSNAVASIPAAAALGAGGYWTGNSNGFLVTVYSLDGSTTVMKVLAP